MNPFVLLSFCGKNRPNGTAACPLFQTLLELHLLVEFTEFENVPQRFFKKLVSTENIWEVRVDGKEKTYRILGFLNGSTIVILNHAFIKKTRKTPKRDIEIAENRRRDYMRRK